jgi:ABC-type transport system substrate-binding protein
MTHRKGVKFHDSSDLTAEVAAFWYKTYKDVKAAIWPHGIVN